MPKVKISEYSATANSNTDVASINIDEGCAPSGINNAIRAIMGHLKDFQSGTNGDPFNGPVNGTLGATTASTAVVTTLTTSSTVTHNGGTANGVAYLNGSKVLTTGSALVFNGTSLGVGVTPNAWATVSPGFQVGPTAFMASYGTSALASTYTGNNAYFDGSNWKYIVNGNAVMYEMNSGNGSYKWNTAASGTAGNAITFTQAMTLEANGNLGIGVTSATGVGGKIVEILSANTISELHITNSTSGSSTLRGLTHLLNGVDAYAYNRENGAYIFGTNNTERARIDSSGNLLVGTTTANGRLSIDSAGTTSATYIIFGRNSAASNKFTVRSDGAGFLDSAAWTYGSDATIKENIEYLEPSNCLSLLLNAKPAKFDYIEGQKANYGYIAQDVQKWLPEAVSETPNGKLGLQDGFINAIGTGAIQALHQLIQEQQALITQLQADVAALKGT